MPTMCQVKSQFTIVKRQSIILTWSTEKLLSKDSSGKLNKVEKCIQGQGQAFSGA